MCPIPEKPLPVLASGLPTNALVAILTIAIIAVIIYNASPIRLTCVLDAAIAEAERTYLDAVETGFLSVANVNQAQTLSTLQLKVSKLREQSLKSSRSPWRTIFEFFKGRTFSVLLCIWEVRDFETQIKILKEGQLRQDVKDDNLDTHPIRAVAFRRRRTSPSPSHT